jgi:hypothetical protein
MADEPSIKDDVNKFGIELEIMPLAKKYLERKIN